MKISAAGLKLARKIDKNASDTRSILEKYDLAAEFANLFLLPLFHLLVYLLLYPVLREAVATLLVISSIDRVSEAFLSIFRANLRPAAEIFTWLANSAARSYFSENDLGGLSSVTELIEALRLHYTLDLERQSRAELISSHVR